MIDDRQQTSRGIGLIILAMLTFATMDALSRYLVATYSIGQLLWVRYLVYPLFALWFCRGSLREGIQTRRPWLQCVRGVILLVEAMFFIGSLRYLPLAETHSIAASTPLFVTVLAAICLREQVKPDRWFAVLAGLVGTLIIIRPGFSAMSAAAVWPLSAAVF
ncbi:MAG: DMT family transporter, partial [Pirellulaceae bacterium]|nr:DMT family transporter [Pirellulaceae bacterium]